MNESLPGKQGGPGSATARKAGNTAEPSPPWKLAERFIARVTEPRPQASAPQQQPTPAPAPEAVAA